MKRALFTALGVLAAATLAACGATSKTDEFIINTARLDEPRVFNSEEEAQRLAFGKVLWDVYQKGVLPGDFTLDGYNREHIASNSFAVADVDGDKREELLVFWESASMAGMTGRVYGYDGETIYEELSVFPSLRFYDNGIVEEDSSHSQNLAGDFWPYFVYQYDVKSDTYHAIGGVDAWDRRVREENTEAGIWPVHFPTDVDADGDGIIYFIFPADWDGSYNDVPMVDGSDYESWRNAYIDGAKELDLPLQELTEENIALLGCPKPDVQRPEPVG